VATEEFQTPALTALRESALTYPGVTEGAKCVKRAFHAGKKTFLYLGEKDDEYNVMVKVEASEQEERDLAEQNDR
jgi:hypothetical protein